MFFRMRFLPPTLALGDFFLKFCSAARPACGDSFAGTISARSESVAPPSAARAKKTHAVLPVARCHCRLLARRKAKNGDLLYSWSNGKFRRLCGEKLLKKDSRRWNRPQARKHPSGTRAGLEPELSKQEDLPSISLFLISERCSRVLAFSSRRDNQRRRFRLTHRLPPSSRSSIYSNRVHRGKKKFGM